jgi:hypothetical protein|tara:strand:- start:62 stop:457 length:396 start_codon:yes stop_codon:yes gene_type:complete
MADIIEFKPKRESDLVVASGEDGTTLIVDSIKTKSTFLRQMKGAYDKIGEVRKQGYTCGDCAAHPCFRNYGEDYPAGLCFQETRECRQECEYFIQDKESGKAPEFQITGTCKRDGETMNYEAECRFLNEDN